MIKSFLIYILSFALLFLCSYGLHSYFIPDNNRYNIFDVYLFFGISSLSLCVVFNLLSKVNTISQQLGFIYLFTLIIKVGLFALLFKESVLSLTDLAKMERLNLLIPLFVFLLLEIYFISRLLSRKKT